VELGRRAPHEFIDQARGREAGKGDARGQGGSRLASTILSAPSRRSPDSRRSFAPGQVAARSPRRHAGTRLHAARAPGCSPTSRRRIRRSSEGRA
jgi:hypothetical protein